MSELSADFEKAHNMLEEARKLKSEILELTSETTPANSTKSKTIPVQVTNAVQTVSLKADKALEVIELAIAKIESIAKELESVKKKEHEHEIKISMLESEVDELQQRNLKGNIIVTSSSKRGKKSLIKTTTELEEENISIFHHISELVAEKYGVTIRNEDIQAIHPLKEGESVLVKFFNRRPESSFWLLTNAMQAPCKNRKLNLYCNFQLTDKRSGLTFLLRRLRREGKIYSHYVNENGIITFKTSKNGKKLKITDAKKTDGDKYLMTEQEVRQLLIEN